MGEGTRDDFCDAVSADIITSYTQSNFQEHIIIYCNITVRSSQ